MWRFWDHARENTRFRNPHFISVTSPDPFQPRLKKRWRKKFPGTLHTGTGLPGPIGSEVSQNEGEHIEDGIRDGPGFSELKVSVCIPSSPTRLTPHALCPRSSTGPVNIPSGSRVRDQLRDPSHRYRRFASRGPGRRLSPSPGPVPGYSASRSPQ